MATAETAPTPRSAPTETLTVRPATIVTARRTAATLRRRAITLRPLLGATLRLHLAPIIPLRPTLRRATIPRREATPHRVPLTLHRAATPLPGVIPPRAPLAAAISAVPVPPVVSVALMVAEASTEEAGAVRTAEVADPTAVAAANSAGFLLLSRPAPFQGAGLFFPVRKSGAQLGTRFARLTTLPSYSC